MDDVRGEGQTLHMPTAPRTAVRILSLARLISLTGSTAAFTALFYTIYHRTGSAAWLSATLLLTFGVSGLIAPVAGILGDRFDRKRVMILSDLGGAVCFGAMALAHDPALLLAAGFLAAVAESPFWSASGAAVPNLVQEKDLAWANGLLAAGRNAGVMIGPAVGGALIHAFGASWLFAGNGVSFVVSAILVATVRASFSRRRGAEEPQEQAKSYRGLRAGFAFLARDRVLRTILLAWFVFILGVGMAMVADVPLAELFGAGAIGYGLINASWGAGSVLGSLAGRRLSERSEVRYLVFGSIGISFCSLGIALSPWFWLVLALSLLFGLGDGATMVAEQGIAQRRTPDAVRSRVMAAFDGGIHLALAGSYALGGIVVPTMGPRGAYALGGVAGILAVLVLLPVFGSLRAGPAVRPAPDAAEAEAGAG